MWRTTRIRFKQFERVSQEHNVFGPSRALCSIGRKEAVFARLDTTMCEDNHLMAMICRNDAVD